jgi:CRP-like cAMP-binding protein
MHDDAFSAHPLIAALPDAERGALRAASVVREAGADETILREQDRSDQVFLLLDGVVRIFYVGPQGSEITAKVLAAPALFGETEALCGVPFMESARAIDRAVVLVVPAPHFDKLLATHASFAHAVVRDLAARFAASIYHEKSLAFDPVTVRLANFVLDHLEWSTVNGRALPHIVLTQEELAAAIGVSRRSITKDLTLWKELGILQKRPRGYLVVKMQELARYADPRRVSLHYSMK